MPYEDEEPPYAEPDPEVNAISHTTIGVCLEVARELGPGLDEALYEEALELKFRRQNVPFARQVKVDVFYRGVFIGEKRLDFIVGGKLVLEIKAVKQLTPKHFAQVRTYLKITHLKLGLAVNFNEGILRNGIKRIVNPNA